MMELKVIAIEEDKSSEIYNSPDCQLLLKVYEEYFPKIGFNMPWVGYFILKEKKIVQGRAYIDTLQIAKAFQP